jgi:hypothetical protein
VAPVAAMVTVAGGGTGADIGAGVWAAPSAVYYGAAGGGSGGTSSTK